MLGLNPGLLRLWHWQSDALTARLDIIHSKVIYKIFFLFTKEKHLLATGTDTAWSTILEPESIQRKSLFPKNVTICLALCFILSLFILYVLPMERK
jgi:hypothetical protein